VGHSGIGYHFSTDRYIDLAIWFDGYAEQIKAQSSSSD
jgi:hypothetical protein